MKAIILFIFFTILTVPAVFGQIKIGDNPQSIDPSSVLELESTSKVFVITRVTTLEMEAIIPLRGGMVYNTDTECINYYDGTQWVNLCDAVNFTITNDPIINTRSTIEITESADGYNLEVAKNSILGDNIIDGGIGPDDIQDNSITQDKLAAESVGSSELRQNSVGTEEIRDGSIAPADIANFLPGQVLTTDENGIVKWQDSDELYDLTFNKLDNTLTISRSTTAGVSTIDLAALVGSDDQQLTLKDNILTLQDGGTPIDLTTYTNTGTDEQTLSTDDSAGNISILNGNEITLNVDDADANASNEIQNIEEVLSVGNNANGLLIKNIGTPTDDKDAVTKEYVDGAVTGVGGVIVSSAAGNDITNNGGAYYDDGDNNSQNELQDIDFDTDNNILTISSPLTPGKVVDLSSLADATVVDGTETVLEGGIKIDVTGDGSNDDPYVINASQVIDLDNGKILIGGDINTAVDAFVNGDATMNNEGLLTINPGVVTPAKIEPAQGALTEDQVLITNNVTGVVEWANFPPGGGAGDDDQNASEVSYDPAASGLTATNTQAAIDELAGSGFVDSDEQNDTEVDLLTAIDIDGDGTNETNVQEAIAALQNIGSDDQNDTEVDLLTAIDIDGDGTNETNVQEAIAALQNIGSDDQNDTEVDLLTAIDIDGDGTNETNVQEAIAALQNIAADDQNDTEVDLLTAIDIDGDGTNETNVQEAIAALQNIGSDDQNDTEVALLTAVDIDGDGTNETNVQEAIAALQNIGSDDQKDTEVALLTAVDIDGDGTNETNVQEAIAALQNIGSDDQNDTEVELLTAIDIDGDGTNETNVQEAIAALQNIQVSGTTGSILFANTDGTITENNAQLFWNNSALNLRLGIGTANPDSKLHVLGQIRASTIANGDGTEGLPAYRFQDDLNSGMWLPAESELAFSTDGNEAMRINATGNVGIGIAPTTKLHVDGDIRAEGEIFATAFNTVPDYVFQKYFLGNSILNPDYEFNDLVKIEAFIKENNHLPGIQSAQAVKEQGFWNVSESSRVNLEKIEELFLHTIEQEKKIKELKAANTNMHTEMEVLKAQMEEIKTMLLEKSEN
ncbi:hypothetical protein LCGC14_0286450 [marine sediment metagenome]|uniref:Peptidase S74 domain-containing protein n=1 Tax=marine sediment metagenome TaxID=412755 RepID=A0A0F9WZY3_9ZZZZ